MCEWGNWFSFLKCLNCGGDLHKVGKVENFLQNDLINGELICTSCNRGYPVIQDIPVMFKDRERERVLINMSSYKGYLEKAEKTMQKASQLTGNELSQFKNEERLEDALSWEVLFWERWKHSDEGFVEFNRDKIKKCLHYDTEGGGRLQFFDKVVSFSRSRDISDKVLLNIGAGRDFLLEEFLNRGCKVIEQDIVLEPLLLLKKRDASFCVCCDARALPFKDNMFNIITSFGVLHHIWPIEESIAELLRVTSEDLHLCEPNYFAPTRLVYYLPTSIRRKLKSLYSDDYSHSPYEASINPFFIKKIIRKNIAKVIKLSFSKTSWISKESKGLMKFLRIVNLILVNLLPLISSHFYFMVRKFKESS